MRKAVLIFSIMLMSLTMAFSADIQGESRDIGVDDFKLVLEKPGITSFYFYDLSEAVASDSIPKSKDTYNKHLDRGATYKDEQGVGVFYQIYPTRNDQNTVSLFVYFIPFDAAVENWDTVDDYMLSFTPKNASASSNTEGLNFDVTYSSGTGVSDSIIFEAAARGTPASLASRTIKILENEPLTAAGIKSTGNERMNFTFNAPNNEVAFTPGVYSGYAVMVLDMK